MSDTWVMTESDKVEKKNAAEVRKKLKLQATQAHDRNQVDLASVPLSSYLQKRAQFKQEIRRSKSHPHPEYQQQNSRTRTNSGNPEYQRQNSRTRTNSGKYTKSKTSLDNITFLG